MRYTAAHLDDGHAALGRFQLLHAGMVLRGIATVPAQRLRMKKASVPHNTCASRAARAAKYPFQGNGRVYVVSNAAARVASARRLPASVGQRLRVLVNVYEPFMSLITVAITRP